MPHIDFIDREGEGLARLISFETELSQNGPTPAEFASAADLPNVVAIALKHLEASSLDMLPLGFSRPSDLAAGDGLRGRLRNEHQTYCPYVLAEGTIVAGSLSPDITQLLERLRTSVKALVITGEGGLGKTRLALELCLRMEATHLPVLVGREASAAGLEEVAKQAKQKGKDLLLLLDYIEEMGTGLSFDYLVDWTRNAYATGARLLVTTRRVEQSQTLLTGPRKLTSSFCDFLDLGSAAWAGWRRQVVQKILKIECLDSQNLSNYPSLEVCDTGFKYDMEGHLISTANDNIIQKKYKIRTKIVDEAINYLGIDQPGWAEKFGMLLGLLPCKKTSGVHGSAGLETTDMNMALKSHILLEENLHRHLESHRAYKKIWSELILLNKQGSESDQENLDVSMSHSLTDACLCSLLLERIDANNQEELLMVWEAKLAEIVGGLSIFGLSLARIIPQIVSEVDGCQIFSVLSQLVPLLAACNIYSEKAQRVALETLGSLSLDLQDRLRVLQTLPSLSEFQLDALLSVYKEEVLKFSDLAENHSDDLVELIHRHAMGYRENINYLCKNYRGLIEEESFEEMGYISSPSQVLSSHLINDPLSHIDNPAIATLLAYDQQAYGVDDFQNQEDHDWLLRRLIRRLGVAETEQQAFIMLLGMFPHDNDLHQALRSDSMYKHMLDGLVRQGWASRGEDVTPYWRLGHDLLADIPLSMYLLAHIHSGLYPDVLSDWQASLTKFPLAHEVFSRSLARMLYRLLGECKRSESFFVLRLLAPLLAAGNPLPAQAQKTALLSLTSLSLDLLEYLRVFQELPTLTNFQLSALSDVFEEEKQKFQELQHEYLEDMVRLIYFRSTGSAERIYHFCQLYQKVSFDMVINYNHDLPILGWQKNKMHIDYVKDGNAAKAILYAWAKSSDVDERQVCATTLHDMSLAEDSLSMVYLVGNNLLFTLSCCEYKNFLQQLAKDSVPKVQTLIARAMLKQAYAIVQRNHDPDAYLEVITQFKDSPHPSCQELAAEAMFNRAHDIAKRDHDPDAYLEAIAQFEFLNELSMQKRVLLARLSRVGWLVERCQGDLAVMEGEMLFNHPQLAKMDHLVLHFLLWMASKTVQRRVALLVAMEQIEPGERTTWTFDEFAQQLASLEDKDHALAMQFIQTFEQQA